MSSSHTSPLPAPGTPESGNESVNFGFENTFARLSGRFYARVDTTPVTAHRLVKVNVELTAKLGLDPEMLASERGVEILAGNRIAEGSEPLAMA